MTRWIRMAACTLSFFTFIFGQNLIVEYNKAMERLDQGKELYFSIFFNSKTDIETLSRIVSLDKIEGTIAYAYANRSEFEAFLQENLMYRVEPHPGELIEFECSDYSEPGSRSEFTKWPSYDGLLNLTKQYTTDFPDLCKLVDVGSTIQGRKIQCLIWTSNVKPSLKPRVLFCGPPHGDELTGVMLAFRLYDLMSKKYKEGDARFKRILDSVEIWSIPLLNLDGTYRGGNSSVSGAQRANSAGVDLNRSYPAGPGMTSQAREQPETKALRDFLIKNNSEFTIGTDFHGGIESCLIPWCGKTAKHPEDTWYMNTAKLLKSKSTGGFSSGVGQAMAMVGYVAPGCFTDFGAYHVRGMKGFCWELSGTKLISESQFDRYWNMYKEVLLTFAEMALTGIQGAVTDSITGKPIQGVQIVTENLDKDSSWVYSYSDGGFYKLISSGTYTLTFSHKDYVKRTIQGIAAENSKKTVLNVKLYPTVTAAMHHNTNLSSPVSIIKSKSGILFMLKQHTDNAEIAIYSTNGMLLKKIQLNGSNNGRDSWNCTAANTLPAANGCYLVHVAAKNIRFSQRIILNK